MIKCTKCGREFKNPQALGGHMRGPHQRETQKDAGSNNPAVNPVAPNNPVEKAAVPGGKTAMVPEDAGSNNPAIKPEAPGNTVEKAAVPSGKTATVQEDAGPNNPAIKPEAPGNTVETVEKSGGEAVPVPEEASKAEQIRNYVKQGYTVKQLTGRFGFSETTIRQEIAKIVPPEGEPIDDKAKQQDNIWPVVRKMGGGMEVISPEAVLRQYMGGTPDGEIELRAIMKFRAAMLMVMDLVNVQKGSAEADAKRMEPILRLMKETRDEQDAAAARAKESSVEIADKAAYETAAQLSQVITQNNAKITESINQIRQAMGGKEENPLAQLLNSMQSMQQMMQMFGIAMPGMTGQAPGGAPAQQWQPPPITHRKRSEIEGGK